ncbi:MAG: hypothetical protein KGL39_26345 [Patescibacteria group bacterium]|nr:hypothetical protein [Patescibacteria group bacterium]
MSANMHQRALALRTPSSAQHIRIAAYGSTISRPAMSARKAKNAITAYYDVALDTSNHNCRVALLTSTALVLAMVAAPARAQQGFNSGGLNTCSVIQNQQLQPTSTCYGYINGKPTFFTQQPSGGALGLNFDNFTGQTAHTTPPISISPTGTVTIPSLVGTSSVLNNSTLTGTTDLQGQSFVASNTVYAMPSVVPAPLLFFNQGTLSGTIGNGGAVRLGNFRVGEMTIKDNLQSNNAAPRVDGVEEVATMGNAQGSAVFGFGYEWSQTGTITADTNGSPVNISGPHFWVTANGPVGGSSGTSSTNGLIYALGNPKYTIGFGALDWNLGNLFEGDVAVQASTQSLTITSATAPTSGDTVTLTEQSTICSINQSSVYTVLSQETPSTIASELGAVVMQNSTLSSAGWGAAVNGANQASSTVTPGYVLGLTFPADCSDATFTASTSVGATETLTLGTITVGGSVARKFGFTINQTPRDSASGLFDDAVISMQHGFTPGTPTSGRWHTFLKIGATQVVSTGTDGSTTIESGVWPMDPNSSLVSAPFETTNPTTLPTPAQQMAYGLYLPNVVFSGGIVSGPNFQANGDGSLTIGSGSISRLVGNAATAGIAMSASGYEGTLSSLLSGGGPGNPTTFQNRYYVGDLDTFCTLNANGTYTYFGGSAQVLTVDNTGAVVTRNIITYPSAPSGSTPPTTIDMCGPSGTGWEESVTWTAGNTVNIGETGGTVHLLGTVSGGTITPSSLVGPISLTGTLSGGAYVGDVSNSTLTPPATGGAARTNGTISLDETNVVDFGADPTGVADSAADINDALSATRSSALPSSYLPSGIFHVTNAINVGTTLLGQGIEGDGGSSIIDISNDFNSSALGVIVLAGQSPGGGTAGTTPTVRNLRGRFHQPPDLVCTVATAATAGATTITLNTCSGIVNGDYVVDVTGGGALSAQPAQSASTTATVSGNVITISPAVLAGATVHVGDTLDFAQPRANFVALSTSPSLSPGSPGIIYPPFIYASGAGTAFIDNVRVDSATKCFDIEGNLSGGGGSDGPVIDHLTCGAMTTGLKFAQFANFPRIGSYEFWNYGFNSTVGGGPAFEQNFYDGTTTCFDIGRTDGVNVDSIQCWQGSGTLDSNFTYGNFAGIAMNGLGSTLVVSPSSSGQETQIGILTLATNAQSAYLGESGRVVISNLYLATTTTADPISITGGVHQVNGGLLVQNTTTAGLIGVSGGRFGMTGVQVETANSAWSVPLISQTGTLGSVQLTGNIFQAVGATATPGIAISIATDNASDLVQANNLTNWTFTPPGALGTYQGGNLSVTTNGTQTLSFSTGNTQGTISTTGSLTSSGIGFATGGGTILQITQAQTGSIANQLVIKGATTTNPVVLAAAGDTNAYLRLVAAGTGEVQVNSHFAITGGGTPTAATCGGTGIISGVDSVFDVTIGGTSSATCTITPGNTFSSTPHVSITPHQLSSGNCAATTATTNSIVITCATATTNGVFTVFVPQTS